MNRDEALSLLARVQVLHLATTTPEGTPVLRALDGVLLGGAVAFHGSRQGEKVRCLGRPAVVSAEEVVARIPSYFVDPERACTASTFYRSVQVQGSLEEVTDPAAKARVLSALMARLQPEGGYLPLDPLDPRYRGEVAGVLVFQVPLDRVDGKAKLGQNRSREERLCIMAGLWKRGDPGDPCAIEAIRAASPDQAAPAFLGAPAGVTLHVALPSSAAPEAAALLSAVPWWNGAPPDLICRVHLAAQAWVGARDSAGRLIGTARSVSDRETAWLYDVFVSPSWRGKGVGRSLIELLLDHPEVRSARTVRLATNGAQGLYAQYGFTVLSKVRRDFNEEEMVLLRSS